MSFPAFLRTRWAALQPLWARMLQRPEKLLSLHSLLWALMAAGLTLPLLQWLGYQPGSQDPLALQRLAWIYALLPCALKLMAAYLLYRLLIAFPHRTQGVTP